MITWLMCRTVTQSYRLRAACLHKGNRADFGHYVAIYREEGTEGWVLCNDSHIVVAAKPPIEECYLVFYERVDEE